MEDTNQKREHKAPENMTGSFWPNSHKKQGDNQPVLRGFATIDGKEYRVALWTRWTPNGIKFLSARFEDADTWRAAQAAAKAQKPASPVDDLAVDSDDMPF